MYDQSPTTPNKKRSRQEVESATEQFLKNGGEITKLPTKKNPAHIARHENIRREARAKASKYFDQ